MGRESRRIFKPSPAFVKRGEKGASKAAEMSGEGGGSKGMGVTVWTAAGGGTMQVYGGRLLLAS